jgi:general secretion pathway protein D
VLRRRFASLIVLAIIVSGCAAGRAFRRGEEAIRNGQWDAAVTYLTQAVQASPDKAEYKIALERAMQTAAREHVSRARTFEEKDQPDAALIEYKKALEMDASNRMAAQKVADLERVVRDRLEASRPKPQIERLREQARAQAAPLLNPTAKLPVLQFTNASLKDILNFIGTNSGINVTYDQQFVDKVYTVNLEDVTVEQALQQIMAANQLFYKVLNPKTIIIVPENPQKHAQYDELVVRVFYLSHSDPQEMSQIVNSLMRLPSMPVQPAMFPNKTANTLTVRATAPIADVIEKIIRANDKPRAEVAIDVQILEVSRQRTKQLGLDLSSYSLGLTFSPEFAPPNTSGTTPPTAPPPFNLNTISQGVSTADFYLTVPTAVVRFLEQDSHSKSIAKPQLRGAEGSKLTLNLGDDIPVVSTVFGAPVAGGFASIPQSSFTYRSVGVNMEITPRVTYEGDIVLELFIESSSRGPDVSVAGQSVPSFGSRKVTTKLRLREGESNLLAGLLRDDQRKILTGLPGIMQLPVLRSLFGNSDSQINQTDIVMLLTPHIVRTHELTAEDLAPIYIGTQQNIGLSGPPPLITPPPAEEAGAAGATTGAPVATTAPSAPGVALPGPPAPGVPRAPVASQPGAQPTNVAPPPGTSPVPTPAAPLPNQPAPAVPAVPTAPPEAAPGVQPAAPPVPPRDQPVAPPSAAPATPPSATVAQVIVTPPGTEFRVAGGPYTVPLSINNASRVSVVSLSLTYNPNVLRVRTTQEGTFMRQGGVTATFTPRIDAAAGRVDIAIARSGDQTGASGAGLLAALVFDAIGPGSSIIQVAGVASTPDGGAVPLQFNPVTVTVR